MRSRWLLIAILVVAVVSLGALSQIDAVVDVAGEWTPSIVALFLLLLALLGSRLAWAPEAI